MYEPSVLGPTTSITPGESVDRETRGGSLSVSTGTTIAEDGRVEWEFDFSRRSEATEVGMTVRLRGGRLAEWRSEVIPHTPIADASVCNHYFCCTNLPERQVSAKLLCRTRALYSARLPEPGMDEGVHPLSVLYQYPLVHWAGDGLQRIPRA